MPSSLLVRYVLTAALRDRVVLAMGGMIILAGALCLFLGSAAAIEGDKFALVFAGGALRLAGALGVVLFVVSTIRRAFESRDVEFLLARPISRASFLFSHALAFALLALGVGAAIGLCLYALGPQSMGSIGGGLWIATLLTEYVMLAFVALFFSMVLPSVPGAALATLGFYVLARMSGQILGTIDAGTVGPRGLLSLMMEAISVLIPRLDLLAQSSWLIYGVEGDIARGLILASTQCLVFSALVLMAALWDLSRRTF